ncbi:MAG: 50S ribosomal protein L18 [Parachlamydiales bacterium]
MPLRSEMRTKRAQRVRSKLRGTAEKPRLSVVKTCGHIHAQVIDDEAAVTLVGISTNSKGFKGTEFGKKGIGAARKLGAEIAQRAKATGVEEIIFDRGPSKYHGILAALADSARENGLKF